jgi:hypothetical protein
MTRQPISKEDFQSLLQRYETAKRTADSFSGGWEWKRQMLEAYETMNWDWLSNLCSGVNQAKKEHEQKSIGNARVLPQRELTPAERLAIAHRRKKEEQDEENRRRMGYRPR